MEKEKGKRQYQEQPGESPLPGTMTRRELVSKLGKAAYVAPAITVLSIGSMRTASAASCPPPNPGGGGGCDVPAEPQQMDKSRVKSRRKPRE